MFVPCIGAAHSRADWEGFVRWWMSIAIPETHSTKPLEDAIAWGLETDPETFHLTAMARGIT